MAKSKVMPASIVVLLIEIVPLGEDKGFLVFKR